MRRAATAAVGVLSACTLAACGSAASHAPAPAAASSATAASGPGALVKTTLKVPSDLRTGAFATTRTLKVPKGATVSVWKTVPGARFDLWTPQKDLLVSVPGSGEILRLHPGKTAAAEPKSSVLVSGLSSPQGLAFDKVGKTTYLYVAENDRIDRYVWKGTKLGARKVVVSGLPGTAPGYAHPAKEVAVGRDHTVYYDVGSSSNITASDRNAGEAAVYSLKFNSTKPSLVMKGVRNGDGLSVDPTGQLWSAVNMRDHVLQPDGTFSTSYGNDHPADEIVKVTKGRDLGWPYCDPDQDLTKGPDRYLNMKFRNDPETNPTGAFDCSKLAPVNRGLPAHSAPLGFTFLNGSSVNARFSTGAVVGTHGSNNHVPPRDAELYWMQWNPKTKTLGAAQPLLAGFDDGSGDRWGKTVDAVPGPDGALYVTDDTAGAVYRLTLPT